MDGIDDDMGGEQDVDVSDDGGSSVGVMDSGGGEASSPAAPQASPWDAFKTLDEFKGADDRQIAARLYTSMEREKVASRALAQYQQFAPVAQEYIANKRDMQEYLQNRDNYAQWKQWQGPQQGHQQGQPRQGNGQPPQQEAAKWWNPPKVRESYKRFLVKDEDGREAISQDAPLEARNELYEYQQYRADFAKRFLENPGETLGPMVQELASKQAQEMIQETFTKRENEGFAASVEQDNRDWMLDQQTGDVTPEGLSVHKYVEEARGLGMKGPQQRWQYAVAMTERDMLARLFDQRNMPHQVERQHQQVPQYEQQYAQPQPQPAPQPPQPPQQDQASQNMQYLRREASRNPSRSAGATSSESRTPNQRRTFGDILAEDASSRGLI